MSATTDRIDHIDKINDILCGLKAQAGAIAMFTNPDHRLDTDLIDISDFFFDMRNRLHDAIELMHELTARKD